MTFVFLSVRWQHQGWFDIIECMSMRWQLFHLPYCISSSEYSMLVLGQFYVDTTWEKFCSEYYFFVQFCSRFFLFQLCLSAIDLAQFEKALFKPPLCVSKDCSLMESIGRALLVRLCIFYCFSNTLNFNLSSRFRLFLRVYASLPKTLTPSRIDTDQSCISLIY